MPRALVPAATALALLLASDVRARADVTIAVAAPFSGSRAAMGEDLRRAAEAAVGEINAKGGLLGERLVLALEDDGCEQATAAAAARALAGRGPALVVGHPCSSAAVAAAPVYAAAGLVFISPGARHPALTEKRAGKTIFRLAGRDDRQGAAAARWLSRSAKERPIAIIHDRTAYARTLSEDAARALLTSGAQNVTVLAIVAGRKEYAGIATRLEAERTGALFFAGYPAEALLILRALRKRALDVPFLGSDALATPEFGAAGVEPNAPVRVLLPGEIGPLPGRSPAEALARASPAQPFHALAARTRGAIEAWADAVRRTGSLAADRVATALSDGAIATAALGPLSFDDNGDARVPSFEPARWDGKRWAPSD